MVVARGKVYKEKPVKKNMKNVKQSLINIAD